MTMPETPEADASRLLIILSADLMLPSQVRAAVGHAWQVQCAGNLDRFRQLVSDCAPDVVLVDLELPALDLPAIVGQFAAGTRVVAYGSHVHTQRLESARQAGCDRVVTRGELSRHARQILCGA